MSIVSPGRCLRTSIHQMKGDTRHLDSWSSPRCIDDHGRAPKPAERLANCWRIVTKNKRKAKSLQHAGFDLGLQFSDANFNMYGHQPAVISQKAQNRSTVHAYTEQNHKTIQTKQRTKEIQQQIKLPFEPIVGVGKKLQQPVRSKPKTAGSPFLKMRKRRTMPEHANNLRPYRQPIIEPKYLQDGILGWQHFQQYNVNDIVDYARRTMYSPMRKMLFQRKVSSVNK